MPCRLRGDRHAAYQLPAEILVVVGYELQSFSVEAERSLLGPAPASLLGRGHQVGERPLGLARLAPVVPQDRGRVAKIWRRFLQEPGHRLVALPPLGSGQGLIRHIADEDMLEGELLLASDAGDRSAPDQVASL